LLFSFLSVKFITFCEWLNFLPDYQAGKKFSQAFPTQRAIRCYPEIIAFRRSESVTKNCHRSPRLTRPKDLLFKNLKGMTGYANRNPLG
jgi:hypothetical protein